MNRWRICLIMAILLLAGCSTKVSNVAITPLIAGHIAYVSYIGNNYEIYLMNTDGSSQKNLTNNSVNDLQPAWSPDGQHIAFSSDRDGKLEIYVMEADGSRQTRLTYSTIGTGCDSPAWSQDGKNIIFVLNQGTPRAEVYIIKADGSEQRRLTDNNDEERELSWSPKGDVLAISANIRASSGIYVPQMIYLMGLDGAIQKRLTPPNTMHPTWSPSGEYISFTSGLDIYTMNADGSNSVNITKKSSSKSVYNIDPSWSPDGKYIVFSSNRDGKYNLYIMKADGSSLTRLTDGPGDETSPVWSPAP
jgi:Tol biopolymer transport system component